MAEKISLWLSHGIHKKLLCRTVGSGAQFTTHAKKMIQAGQAGDLMAQDELAFAFASRFVVECKFWRDLQFLRFLEKIDKGKDDLYNALIKVKGEATNLNKQWMLAVKQNRRRDLLFLPTQAMPYMKEGVEWNWLFNGSVYMFYQDDFFSKIDPDVFISNQREQLPMR